MSVPSSRAGNFQCNPVLAEIPGTVRTSGNRWGARKNLHGYYTSSASLTTSGNSFRGLFKICMIGIFTSLWKALDILNCISSLESAGTSSWTPRGSWGCSPGHGAPRFLQIRCEGSVLVLREETNCCWLRSLLGLSVGRNLEKCRAVALQVYALLCGTEKEKWIICREVEWISVQKQTGMNENSVPGVACVRVRLRKVNNKRTESAGKNDKTFWAPKPIEWSIAKLHI